MFLENWNCGGNLENKQAQLQRKGVIPRRTVAALRNEASHFEGTPHAGMLTEREGHKCLVNEAAVAALGR